MHWCFNVCMIFKQLPHILAEQKVTECYRIYVTEYQPTEICILQFLQIYIIPVVFALHDVAVVPNALSHDI